MVKRPRSMFAAVAGVAMVASLAASNTIEGTWSSAASLGTRVVYADNFSGPLDTKRLNTCFWWDDGGCTIATNHELEWYLPSGVSVSNGALHLTAQAVPVRNRQGHVFPYRSGMVSTGPVSARGSTSKLAFTYGRVEARVRMTKGAGLWPAVWLLPASRRSRPEIDILEVIGQRPHEALFHLHPKAANSASPELVARLPGPTFAEGWHVVALNWRPRSLEWFLDGKSLWRLTGARVPSEPMYLVMNLAVGGDYPGTPPSNHAFPATFSIDYVRIIK
jgi:beta-glucanase (GH16 family)